MVIYRITNKLNGMQYVGQATNLKRRWKDHGRKNSNCILIRNAIQKYGKYNFSIGVLGEYNSIEEANQAESYFIEFINTLAPSGYNLNSGGDNKLFSEASRKKMSVSHMGHTRNKGKCKPNATSFKKGMIPWNKGKHIGMGAENSFYGKTHSDETKKLLSNIAKNRNWLPSNKGMKWRKDPVTGKRIYERK